MAAIFLISSSVLDSRQAPIKSPGDSAGKILEATYYLIMPIAHTCTLYVREQYNDTASFFHLPSIYNIKAERKEVNKKIPTIYITI